MAHERLLSQACDLLDWIGSHGIGAAICGGFVRDAICERNYRDIDIYVDDRQFRDALERLGCSDLPYSADHPEEGSDAYVHQSVRSQVEFVAEATLRAMFPMLQGHNINLVGLLTMGDPEDIVSRFNLGVCQAGLARRQLFTSLTFRQDVEDKAITLLRDDWGYEATMKQFLKLQEKYPWPLRVPPPVGTWSVSSFVSA